MRLKKVRKVTRSKASGAIVPLLTLDFEISKANF